MTTPLFTNDEASDPAYGNIRDAKSGILQSARFHCEYLWILFQHHADKEFRIELRREFDARYWEMYLTMSLMLAGYEVTCPKPGPDVGIIHRGQRVWFEATSPTAGAPDSADYIATPTMGEVSDIPQEKIVLRYLNSITDKYERQYANWLAKGVVSGKDAFVIALNPRSIPFDYADTQPPRILQAAYTVGAPYIVIDRGTMQSVGSGYHFRDHVAKASGTEIQTGVFQRKDYAGLSALLCSRVDAVNRPSEMGDDFQLAPNPHADVKLLDSFRLRGVYFGVRSVKDGYAVTPV